MGGLSMADDLDWEELGDPGHTSKTTFVLVGRTGNGKSASGNSILGYRAFKSKSSTCAITTTCELKQIQRLDGRLIQVVDTPGLFDPSMQADFVGKELMNCIELAKDGVHGILLVLSVLNRFTAEEMVAVESLQMLFGEKVVDYMIVLFTGGDELEDDDETLDEYFLQGVPDYLTDLLRRCGNRRILFNNKTKDNRKKEHQLVELLKITDTMLVANGGKPYSKEIFQEAKELLLSSGTLSTSPSGFHNKEFEVFKQELERAYKDQLDQVTKMVEEKLRLNAERLEEKLESEQRAREEVERLARESKAQSDADIKKLHEELERAKKEREEFQKRWDSDMKRSQCTIL
ncbi:hypothetical protein O6H91_13G043800 [Diphasiastrum complanatum]|uniref:Uncharacterized protein n=1 Tax=Diphasiastrum complanatum TaxID=34168 RepID=A0ACC2BU73_DIPCM|nr:hypothetical protein O6H91_13G043800 [Diphasiastrum complanatum]